MAGKFKIAILCIGPVDLDVVREIQSNLCEVFPETVCVILKGAMPIPQDAYNVTRGQYCSSRILAKIHDHIKRFGVDCVLGITAVDLYIPRLNFVFGEAQCPGSTAIISLFRLKPEFYNQQPDRDLFIERSIKEAVHELGHAIFGLMHCPNPRCVMHFSNSIVEVDIKTKFLCERCKLKVNN